MGFYRQLDWVITVLTTVLVFVACTFLGGFPVTASLLIAAIVFLAELRFGWRISKGLEFF